MHPKLFRLLHIVTAVSIVRCLLKILDVMISLKYEIKDDDCTSAVTGHDLCFALNGYRVGALAAFLILVAM